MKRVFFGIVPEPQAPHLFDNVLDSITFGLDNYLHGKKLTQKFKDEGGQEFKVTVIIERI